MKKLDITWHQVLKDEGFNSEISESLIGFIAWEENNMFSKMGKEINDVLMDYEGKVIAKDVYNNKYNNTGILFVKKDISEKAANRIFNSILNYEHKEVYDLK